MLKISVNERKKTFKSTADVLIQLKLYWRRLKIILIAMNAPCHSVERIESVSTVR